MTCTTLCVLCEWLRASAGSVGYRCVHSLQALCPRTRLSWLRRLADLPASPLSSKNARTLGRMLRPNLAKPHSVQAAPYHISYGHHCHASVFRKQPTQHSNRQHSMANAYSDTRTGIRSATNHRGTRLAARQQVVLFCSQVNVIYTINPRTFPNTSAGQ